MMALSTFAIGAGAAVPTAEIRTAEDGCPNSEFVDDSLELVIRDGKRQLASYVFCSSYGKSDARVVSDKRGRFYVVLTYGEGRGTNARTEYISVLPIREPIVPIATIPIEGPAGFTSRWRYDYRTETPSGGGLKFVLSLRAIGDRAAVEGTPKEVVREIFIK
jgi:hypothetical protein